MRLADRQQFAAGLPVIGEAWSILIGGVVELLYTTRPIDSLCEDTVGLPETRYFF